MLIQDFIDVSLPLEEVEDRLIHSSDLGTWAAAAYARGEQLAVGPGVAGVAARVELEVGKPLRGSDSVVIPFAWRAVGSRLLFPHMEAELVLTPLGSATTTLSFRGSYRPPLGGLGEVLDRVAMHRLAQATVRNFLERLTDALTADPAEVQTAY